MIQARLSDHVLELCDVLRQVGRVTPDGPCWCDGAETSVAAVRSHSEACRRARTALQGALVTVGSAAIDAPGYGFGV